MNIFKTCLFLLFPCYIEPRSTCQKKKVCRSNGVACDQYKEKGGKNDQKNLNCPIMSIFSFLKKYVYVFSAIPKNRDSTAENVGSVKSAKTAPF